MPESSRPPTGSGTPIDVIIPAIEKDLGTLPFVIDGVRKQVKHPIHRIFIVSPNSEKIKSLCARKGCIFVDETRVLPITKKHIRYGTKKWNRSGWLYQQLLKLSGDRISTQRYFLVIDADTVLIRPHIFRSGDKTVFYYRDWSQPEYYRTYAKLMGRKKSSRRSFVAHYMLFDKTKLARLKRDIEERHQEAWYSAIIRSIDKTKQFGFSEFETYGNYLHTRDPGGIVFRKCLNKSLSTSASAISEARAKTLAKKYRSLSFHKRKIYARGAFG
ncbi:DUF6492 family protein [Paenibacillus hamazuiensis]|uniref:DUF6492 family protein n=1 Tax=Paenibacillus hamazuiensis TaxID=2936508 RepID=UPI0020105B7E|nr:DUF6492 family protein [Paenibacillus hamazuiensis]